MELKPPLNPYVSSCLIKINNEQSRRRKKLVVATSKVIFFAVKLLTYFKLNKHFSLIMGSNLDGTRANKTEVIACALQAMGFGAKVPPTAMAGDRKYDLLGG